VIAALHGPYPLALSLQAMMPFGQEELAYISSLDAHADCALLARELPHLRPECLRVLQVSTLLLKASIAEGMRWLVWCSGVCMRKECSPHPPHLWDVRHVAEHVPAWFMHACIRRACRCLSHCGTCAMWQDW